MDRHRDAFLVLVGRVMSPVGFLGEVRVGVFSDVPQRFSPGAEFSVNGSSIQISDCRSTTKGLVVKFHGVDSRKAAEAIGGKGLYVSESAVPPPPAQDTYYYFQVLGMQVVTVEGEEVGTVTDILATGANDVYVVNREGRETLVPAMASVVVEVDVDGKRMTVDLPQGL